MSKTNVKSTAALLLAGVLLGQISAVRAQSTTTGQQMPAGMRGMDHSTMGSMPMPSMKTKPAKKVVSNKAAPKAKRQARSKRADEAAGRKRAEPVPMSGMGEHEGMKGMANSHAIHGAKAKPAQEGMQAMQEMQDHQGMKGMPTAPGTKQKQDHGNMAGMEGMPGHEGMEGMPAAEKTGKQDHDNMKGMAGMQGVKTMPGHEGMKAMPATQGMTQKQEHNMAGMAGMQQGDMKGMKGMTGSQGAAGMDMQGMTMGPMQGGTPPPGARDPAAYAEGTTNAHLGGHTMNDDALFGRVLFNNLELATGDGERGQNIDAEAWYGGDVNKVWLKAEGARRAGKLEAMRTEALWDRTFATFWSTQFGVRHDIGGGPRRDWLAFGVRGLAPYWFDTEVTGYWRGGQFAARADVRYEILFTPRLILQPELATDLYSKSDSERGIGSGVSDIELGLRLRYEIRRQFAPYIGVTWSRRFGQTADFAQARGAHRKAVQAVAGVRVWF